jgi:hypothetical protein
VTMVDRRVRIAMTFADGQLPQRCAGPGADSMCPLAGDDGVVACAGATVVALRGTSVDGQTRRVDRAAGPRCPLAGLVRQIPAPWD